MNRKTVSHKSEPLDDGPVEWMEQRRFSRKGEAPDHTSAERTKCRLEQMQLAQLPAAVDAQPMAAGLCGQERCVHRVYLFVGWGLGLQFQIVSMILLAPKLTCLSANSGSRSGPHVKSSRFRAHLQTRHC